MADEKIYVGNGKKITTQYGDMMRLSMTAEDVEKLQQNLDNGWVNLVVKERREPSPTGLTHYLEVDTWKPDPSKASTGTGSTDAAKSAPKPASDDISPEDLPF